MIGPVCVVNILAGDGRPGGKAGGGETNKEFVSKASLGVREALGQGGGQRVKESMHSEDTAEGLGGLEMCLQIL